MRRFWLGLLALVLLAPLSRSEPDGGFDPADHRRLFSVRDTNAARNKIEEARLALASGETLRGLTAAQEVLDEMEDDFFLEKKSSSIESVLWRSATEVVRELLAALTPEQQAQYEILARPSAAPLLARALRNREEKGLREVLQRFGASSTGVRAARILADIALEAGRTRDAARYVQEGLRFAPTDVGLWRRLIDAHAAGGDRAALAALEPPADATVPVGDEDVTLAELQRRALAALPKPSGRTGWPMWGGVPARNGHFGDETPMPNRLRWKEGSDWQLRRMDSQSGLWGRSSNTSEFADRLQTLRPLQPVSDGSLVFVADGRSVRAYDVYSGRRVWQFDGRGNGRADRMGLPLVRPGTRQHGRTSLERAFSPVVAGDVVIATVEVPYIYEPDKLQGIEITTYKPRRILVALDRQSGRLRWYMGQRGVEALTLDGLSIVSPPAVAEGLVIAVASYGDLIHNVDFLALDLRTGALRWRRPLGTGQQELNLFGSPLKELAASPVAVRDGIAYASTGLGFMAAVDIRSGIPRWLASYEIQTIKKVQDWYAAPVRIPQVASAPPVVQGDLVVIAPTDAMHLYAFDATTGKLAWRQTYRTTQMVHGVPSQLLGVANDGTRDVVLLADHELRARALKTGVEVWKTRFTPLRDRVMGQGALAGDEILVPTASGLHRFSLSAEGAFRGRVPWPEGAQPGNLLPLGRVLIVTSRTEIQWFYDWAAIERDVKRRRELRPNDPTILLEAGEIYLRGGGETERARKAFEEAKRIAERAQQPEYVARALQGLFQTWIEEGDQRAAFPSRAQKAYRQAMTYARSPDEFVIARVRLHHLLADEENPAARIKNLEALVDEAEGAVGTFEQDGPPLPARAQALMLLAREQLGRDRPAEAVDALQRILTEERSARFPEGPAGERAQHFIGMILQQAGEAAYRRHERRARDLLARARSSNDEALLDQLLSEYPNAAVVTDALLELGRRKLEGGAPKEAAGFLRRLLAGADPKHPLLPAGLAALTDAYSALEAWGAALAAADRLAEEYAVRPFRWRGAEFTGTQFARDARTRIHEAMPTTTFPAAATQKLTAPLSEVHFERAGDEVVARAVELSAPDGQEAPLSLVLRDQELLAIDMGAAEVLWSASTGPCYRAAWTEGSLVIAVLRAFRGLDPATGKERWRLETGAMVRALAVARGIVYAHVQDVQAGGGTMRLMALDAFTGIELWSRELERADQHGLRAWRDRVVLHQVSYTRTGSEAALGIYDSFTGTPRQRMPIPTVQESTPVVIDGTYCLAASDRGRRKRSLLGIDLATGALRWQKSLGGSEPVTALAAADGTLLVLRTDGTLVTYGVRNGTPLQQTRIYVGDRAAAKPYPGTHLLVSAERVTLMPRLPSVRGKMPMSVLSYDRRTGKLVWEAPFASDLRPSKVAFFERDGVLVSMISHYADGVQNAVLRLIDADSGSMIQEIEPEGLTRDRLLPSMMEGRGTIVIVGKTGASIFHGPGAGGAAGAQAEQPKGER